MEETLLKWMNNAGAYFKMISVYDIVDIILVALAIYYILRFVRRTRAGQLIQAIVILLIIFAVASVLNLRVVRYIMSNVVEIGVIVLVIIFQPEIRKMLERMGTNRFRGIFASKNVSADVPKAIEQTVEAYTSMSKDKVGALMVFERNTVLDDVIKTGTPLDASVSAELLKNLFWNKAPLHDGAVIVRNGRIVGAGCMLPLSGNTNLSQDLGMRHRAGIGMSENSDAVVAIVSEETGSISVAINGMLKRHLSSDTLNRLLLNELTPKKEDRKTAANSRSNRKDKSRKETESDG